MIKTDERRLLRFLEKYREPYLWESAEALGIPYKRARYIAFKWADRDLCDYGVSWRCARLTDKGLRFAEEQRILYGDPLLPQRDLGVIRNAVDRQERAESSLRRLMDP